jgi:hypothetical protein
MKPMKNMKKPGIDSVHVFIRFMFSCHAPVTRNPVNLVQTSLGCSPIPALA